MYIVTVAFLSVQWFYVKGDMPIEREERHKTTVHILCVFNCLLLKVNFIGIQLLLVKLQKDEGWSLCLCNYNVFEVEFLPLL